jgi:hypothetical protein
LFAARGGGFQRCRRGIDTTERIEDRAVRTLRELPALCARDAHARRRERRFEFGEEACLADSGLA